MALPRRSLLLLVLSLLPACAGPRPASAPAPARPGTETIAFQTSEATGLAFDLSPDGRWIALDLLGQLWRLPVARGAAVALTDAVRDTAQDLDPVIAPDGYRIAFRGERGGRRGLWLRDSAGAFRQLTQHDEPDGHDGRPAWAPDGRTIAFSRLTRPDSTVPRPRSVIVLLDVATGAARTLRLPGGMGVTAADPAWHPDGRRIALVGRMAPFQPGGRIWLVDTVSGALTALTDSGVVARAPAFSPQGERIAYFAPDSAGRVQVWVRDVASDRAARRVTGHADVTPTTIAWAPDGERLLYGADGGLWSVAGDGTGAARVPFSAALEVRRPVRRLPPAVFAEPGIARPARGFMGLALSPDARNIGMIALGRLWVAPVGGPARAVADVPATARYLTWAPDGSEVAWSAGPLEREDLFATTIATGATRRVATLPGREIFPAWSPDGRWLAFVHADAAGKAALRLVAARGPEVLDTTRTRSLGAVPSEWTGTAAYAPVWSPDATMLLVPSPNYDAAEPAHAELVPLAGARRAITLADSPIFVQWTAGSLVYSRHAQLWRVAFDSTGPHGKPAPVGPEAAMFPSTSAAGDILYLSEGGLHLRPSTGADRALGWPLSYTPPTATPLLVANARVIDGRGSAISAAQDVLIERGRITRIAPAGTLQSAGNRLDAGGGFLMPGLMDLHAHEYQPELLPGFLYFGVTTIRDQGAPIGPVIAFGDAVAAGTFAGPRVGYGGFQFYSDWYFDAEDGHGIEPEADAAHVERAVALAAALGAQHIKTRTFRRWDINARMVVEAHRRGLRVTGHCAHPLPLVAVGFDTKEHAAFCNARDDAPIYDDLVQLYKAAGIGVVPTVIYTALAAKLDRGNYFDGDTEQAPFIPPITGDDWMIRLDAAGRARVGRVTDVARATAARLVRAGVRVGVGTDVWQVPAGVHMEMEELVAAGLTPLEAIRAATGDAAWILGAERDLGTVEVGKRADLVLLDADPVADIRNTRRIRAVIQDGRVVDRGELRARYARPSP